MELFEALVISFINTVIVLALHGIKVKTRIEVYGPFSYELDESGALKELQAQHIPIEFAETLRKKILSEIEPSKNRKLAIVIFALMIFIIQLVILLSV